MKKFTTIIMTCFMFMMSFNVVSAEEIDKKEQYELQIEDIESGEKVFSDIVPYAKYIMDVHTTITKKSSSSVGIRADVYCIEKVSKIDITFSLQKLSGSTWVTVATANASAANVASTAKSITASGLSGGTYRGKANVKVTDKYGYSETATSYTGGIKVG